MRDTILFYFQGVSLNKLSRDQLAGVGDSFKRSRNTTALNQFMDKIENGIAITLANQMSVSRRDNNWLRYLLQLILALPTQRK